jgi:hypothetical protein
VAAWRDVVDRAVDALGHVTPVLARHWRSELDDVESRVAGLERSAPAGSADDGLHAFAALAGARLGEMWQPRQLVDVAAAAELAYRATRHHEAVVNVQPAEADGLTGAMGAGAASAAPRSGNTRVVLDGDWSITQAAVLVADIGPTAYRLLVRGYGRTQMARLSGGVDRSSLLRAAAALGGLVASVPPVAVDRVWVEGAAWNGGVAAAQGSPAAAVLVWAGAEARAGQVFAGTLNARSVPVSAPIDVHALSRSTTTSPAVGRS